MNNKRGLPTIVIFAILTTITTFVWIGFEAYRAYTKEPALPVPEAVLNPLDPNLDINTLSSVANRVYLKEEEIGTTELESLATQTPAETVDVPTDAIQEIPEATSAPTETLPEDI